MLKKYVWVGFFLVIISNMTNNFHKQSDLNKMLTLLWAGDWTGWYLKVSSNMNRSMILYACLYFDSEASSSLLKCSVLNQNWGTDMFLILTPIILSYWKEILEKD